MPFLASTEDGHYAFWVYDGLYLGISLFCVELLLEAKRYDLLDAIARSIDETAAPNRSFVAGQVLFEWLKLRAEEWSLSSDERVAALRQIRQLWESGQILRDYSLRGRIDLHNHTIYSDGFFTPSYLLLENWLRGVSVISVTDHNTFDGLPESVAAAQALDIGLIPGIG